MKRQTPPNPDAKVRKDVRARQALWDRIEERATKEGLNFSRMVRSLLMAGLWTYDTIDSMSKQELDA